MFTMTKTIFFKSKKYCFNLSQIHWLEVDDECENLVSFANASEEFELETHIQKVLELFKSAGIELIKVNNYILVKDKISEIRQEGSEFEIELINGWNFNSDYFPLKEASLLNPSTPKSHQSEVILAPEPNRYGGILVTASLVSIMLIALGALVFNFS